MSEEDADESDGDDEPFEYNASFVGPCTCEHEEEDHGWGSCGVEGCECQAGWEE